MLERVSATADDVAVLCFSHESHTFSLFIACPRMEFTEAESNMNDLVSEYQQYQDATAEEEALSWITCCVSFLLSSRFSFFVFVSVSRFPFLFVSCFFVFVLVFRFSFFSFCFSFCPFFLARKIFAGRIRRGGG